MTISDYLMIGVIVSVVLAIIADFILKHVHFKDVKKEQKKQAIQTSLEHWVAYFDRQAISNQDKFNGVLDQTVKDAAHSGFNLSDRDVEDIKAGIEFYLSQQRVKQAEAGIDRSVQPQVDTAKDVPEKDIVEPVSQVNGDPEAGDANGK